MSIIGQGVSALKKLKDKALDAVGLQTHATSSDASLAEAADKVDSLLRQLKTLEHSMIKFSQQVIAMRFEIILLCLSRFSFFRYRFL